MKKRKPTIHSFFYSYCPGILIKIFSYLPDNKSCLNLALSSKNTLAVYESMRERSSPQIHQLKYLNNLPRRDYTIDLFTPCWNKLYCKFEINPDLYCATIEEYEKMPPDYGKITRTSIIWNIIYYQKKYKIYTVIWTAQCKIIDILKTINKKHGLVAMIAGGYALKLFTKKKTWIGHSEESRLYVKKRSAGFSMHVRNINMSLEEELSDIDIFLIGSEKVSICKEILKVITDELLPFFEFNECSLEFLYLNGLLCINVKYSISNDDGDNTFKLIQIILKENVMFPNDIFCMFDLDCCKIGYFPGIKVVAPIDFIRSISIFVNYAPFSVKDASKRNIERIYKYAFRTNIRTSVFTHPHQLSYYHDFIDCVVPEKDIKKWEIKPTKKKHKLTPFEKFAIGYVNPIDYFNSVKKKINTGWLERDELILRQQKNSPYFYKIFGIKKIDGKYKFSFTKCSKSDYCFEYLIRETNSDYTTEKIYNNITSTLTINKN